MVIVNCIAAVIPWILVLPPIVRMVLGLAVFAIAFFPEGAYLLGSPIFFYVGFANLGYAITLVLFRYGPSMTSDS